MDKYRRSFIKRATGGLAAAPLLASGAAVNATSDGRYDTIVIGGGFAGVTAAREASLRGLKTLLVEAQPRLGGRTLTLDLAEHQLDVGGTWIGWGQPHVWAEVMRYELAIEESAAAVAERAVWMEARRRVEGPYEVFAKLFERAAEAFYAPARAAFPRPFDPLYVKGLEKLDAMNATEAIEGLDISETERGIALSLATINGHSPADQSSYLDQLRWMALGNFDVWNMFDNLGRYRVHGGTKRLLDRIHADSRAETLLEMPIDSVTHNKDGVIVKTKSGERFRARTVIVAVPLNCLVDIEFKPGLAAAKRRVSKARHTGSGTKFYVRIKSGESPVMCTGTHDMPFNFLWTEYDDKDSQILVGFGASEDLLDIHSDAAVQSAVRQYLPNAELIESFTYDWNVDPYARGSWCMYRPNVLTQDFAELQRAEGDVYFAGADIANGWRGFIDGAIESGMRVGHQVSARLARE